MKTPAHLSALLAVAGGILTIFPPPAAAADLALPDPAAFVEGMASLVALVSPHDTNKNDRLSDAEKSVLAAAIADGTITVPVPPMADGSGQIPVEIVVGHMASVYTFLAPFDANRNGQLDGPEQEALWASIQAGELPFPPPPVGFGNPQAPAEERAGITTEA